MIPLRDDNVPSRTPIVTRTFVGLCVLAFLWQMTLGPQGGQATVYAQALPAPNSTIPMIGASGAISGVLGAYLLLFPHARVLVAIPLGFVVQTVRMPAGAVLALWFVLQLLSNLFASGEGGVAFRAHIGGFIAGMLLIPLFKRKDVPLRSLLGGR